MSTEIVNGEISITVPDGFHVLEVAELSKFYNDSNPDRWGMADNDRHMVVSIFWHKNNALVSAIAGPKDACKGTEKKLSKAMKNYGYVLEGFYQRAVCDLPGYGFRHRYKLRGEDYVSEITLFKKGRVCYTVYCYTRVENESANRPILSDVMDSLAFIQD